MQRKIIFHPLTWILIYPKQWMWQEVTTIHFTSLCVPLCNLPEQKEHKTLKKKKKKKKGNKNHSLPKNSSACSCFLRLVWPHWCCCWRANQKSSGSVGTLVLCQFISKVKLCKYAKMMISLVRFARCYCCLTQAVQGQAGEGNYPEQSTSSSPCIENKRQPVVGLPHISYSFNVYPKRLVSPCHHHL